jgi:competence protein ComEC
MTGNSWVIFCLAYIVGLLSTNFLTISSSGLTTQQLCLLIAGLSGLTLVGLIAKLVSGIVLNKLGISLKVCLSAGILAILAVIYFQLRIPHPSINDIVYQVSTTEREVVTVVGKVVTEPRLNSSHKIKFWLEAQEINNLKKVSGKVYVSLPLLQGTGIDLGEKIELKGTLYVPPATVGKGFDFKAYLARQGIFAGMQGLEVINHLDSEPIWGWWKLRRRIVRSHLRGLGSPKGQLVSSMVLGSKAVDLPVDIRDRFIEAGLAHVLAASGFQVSLLLGLVLQLSDRLGTKPRLIIGISVLIAYLGLTGIQASVLRACLMGLAVLIAIAIETKVKPLGSLLLAATLILLFDPLLIGDLGFQLSFLATFGLIVTMPELQAKLDWLPPTIATLVAVPLAASIWVLPLLCYVFNIFATYSIIVNILATPLIMVISLGGMFSAIAAIILPVVGSAIAWLLIYPTGLLITGIDLFTSLPGSSWAIGQISLGVLLIIYGLLILIWLNQNWSKYWRLILLFVLIIIIVPIGYRHFNLTQITVLPTQIEPVMIIQDRGKVLLVNSDTPTTFQYTVLPFLNQQGINHLDYYVNLNQQNESGVKQISDRLSLKNILLQSEIKTKTLKISFDNQLSLLKIETAGETWLILGKTNLNKLQIQEYIQHNNLLQKSITLVSSSVPLDWLQLSPKNIISFAQLTIVIPQNLEQTKFYNLKQRGTVTWTPQNKLNQTPLASSWNNIF